MRKLEMAWFALNATTAVLSGLTCVIMLLADKLTPAMNYGTISAVFGISAFSVLIERWYVD